MNNKDTENAHKITVTDSRTGKKASVGFALKIVAKKDFIDNVSGELILHGFDGLSLPIARVEEDPFGDDRYEVDLGLGMYYLTSKDFMPQPSLPKELSPELEDLKASIDTCHTWIHRASNAANQGDIERAKYWLSAVRKRLLPYQELDNK